MSEFGFIISILLLCLTYDNKSKKNYSEENSCVPLYRIKYINLSGCINYKIMTQYDIDMSKALDSNFKIVEQVPHWGKKSDTIIR